MRHLTLEQRAFIQEPLASLQVSVRTRNGLERAGLLTVEDLLMKTPSWILGLPNFGQKTLKEIYQALAKEGLHRTRK